MVLFLKFFSNFSLFYRYDRDLRVVYEFTHSYIHKSKIFNTRESPPEEVIRAAIDGGAKVASELLRQKDFPSHIPKVGQNTTLDSCILPRTLHRASPSRVQYTERISDKEFEELLTENSEDSVSKGKLVSKKKIQKKSSCIISSKPVLESSSVGKDSVSEDEAPDDRLETSPISEDVVPENASNPAGVAPATPRRPTKKRSTKQRSATNEQEESHWSDSDLLSDTSHEEQMPPTVSATFGLIGTKEDTIGGPQRQRE